MDGKDFRSDANIVRQQQRSKGWRDEPTGEVERLKASEIRMGSAISSSSSAPFSASATTTRGSAVSGNTSSDASKEKKYGLIERKRTIKDQEEKNEKKKKRRSGLASDGVGRNDAMSGILSDLGSNKQSKNVLNQYYAPKTKDAIIAYELILSLIQRLMGDISQDTLQSAAEEIITAVRNPELTPMQQKNEVKNIIKAVNDDDYRSIVTLSQSLIDFGNPLALDQIDDSQDAKRQDSRHQNEVAVMFDDDEEDEEDNESDQSDKDIESENEDDNIDGADNQEIDREVQEIDSNNENDEDDGEEEFNIGYGKKRGDDMDTQTNQLSSEKGNELNVLDIDAFWLQRELSSIFPDANESKENAKEILKILDIKNGDDRICETKLVSLLDFDQFELIKKLLRNRKKIYFCTKLSQAQSTKEREAIEDEMRSDTSSNGESAADILDQLKKNSSNQYDSKISSTTRGDKGKDNIRSRGENDLSMKYRPSRTLDLRSLKFADAGRLMTNRKCELPQDSWRLQEKSHEEVHVPPFKAKPFTESESLVKISSLPQWMQPAFKGMTELNRIQSRIFPSAFGLEKRDDELIPNLLICAPTGAGKTNVAMLTILNELKKYVSSPDDKERNDALPQGDMSMFNQSLMKKELKIVYIAPMKALVQEIVANFSSRLTEAYGIVVRELSGDQQLSRAEIADTQIIVTTPEKWDVVTRKSGERAYTQLVRLIIMDEIHLLHDSRGAVLECIVARTLRQVEETQQPVRLVGISATLPNYEDIATFLRVPKEKGLFYFDSSYRPVPLQQQYIGITERRAVKQMLVANEICFTKVMEHAGKDQILIFVHSRKETVRTAKSLRDTAIEQGLIGEFLRGDKSTAEILREEAEKLKNGDLKDLLPYGFAVHHAGMNRSDRKLVEDMFADKSIQVLVSTATLAWGVNLPAHTVIIKGTQIYSPELGRWTELSHLDILQMLGRAGRPQYDTEGEGIIITSHEELQYYLSLVNQQLPIESQLISRLADSLNAEIVAGSVQSLYDGARWLGYTYLYVRMIKNPSLYGLPAHHDDEDGDTRLLQRRIDLIHSAAILLEKAQLIRYDRRTGVLHPTALGRVASYFYVGYETMGKFNELLNQNMNEIDLFRIFSLSQEFSNITVRQEEKIELGQLMQRVPIPIKETIEDPSAKVNILLQAYISGLKLEGYSISCDLVFIHQSASRIMRALLEVCLHRGWALLSKKALEVCLMVDRRMWKSQSPLRQFLSNGSDNENNEARKLLDENLLKSLEKKAIRWDRYFDMSPTDLGGLIRNPQAAKQLHKLIHCFPRFELAAHIQPITRSTLKVELTIIPNFEFVEQLHGNSLQFYIIVEDVDGEQILHYELFTLKRSYAKEEHMVMFTVPLTDPLSPFYYIRFMSDRWLHCEDILPISFQKLILPEKFSPHTEVLDLQPLPVDAVINEVVKSNTIECTQSSLSILFPRKWKTFNPIQTQTFNSLFHSNHNVFVAAPTGIGKTICAEFAMLRAFVNNPESRIVYISAIESLCVLRFQDWSERFGSSIGKSVSRLTGDIIADLKILQESHIIIATADQWDAISRGWRQKSRRFVHEVDLFVVDELQHVAGSNGSSLEIVVSRIRYIAAQLEKTLRIVALSAPVANATDIGNWLGCESNSLFSFSPSARPTPLEIFIRGFDISHFGSRIISMAKPCYNAIIEHSFGEGASISGNMYSNVEEDLMDIDGSSNGIRAIKPTIVFVPSLQQTILTSIDLVAFALADGNDKVFNGKNADNSQQQLIDRISDSYLRKSVMSGVGYLNHTTIASDQSIISSLYQSGVITVLVVESSIIWEFNNRANLVVVMDTTRYDGREHQYVDVPVSDIMHMIGFASYSQYVSKGSKALVFCASKKKEFFKKFLYAPLPVESSLDRSLADYMNAEIVNKTIENKQDAVDYLTWTLLYRRLTLNPNYYNMLGTTAEHLSDFMSELVENTLQDLEKAKCVQIEDDFIIHPMNFGMIASHYSIKYTSIELYSTSIDAKIKLRGVLEVLCASAEFEDIPVRYNEEKALQSFGNHLPQSLTVPDYSNAHVKANVLLQCHFSRSQLPNQTMRNDQRTIITEVPKLLQAMIDVMASNGWLKPVIIAMECSQMTIQAMWLKESPLKQIPHFDDQIIQILNNNGVQNVFDILEMEDDIRERIFNQFKITEAKMNDIAKFCNEFPSVEMQYQIRLPESEATGVRAKDNMVVQRGENVSLLISLLRDVVEEEDDSNETAKNEKKTVYANAPYYPKPKIEGWWLVLGDPNENLLLSIKKLNSLGNQTETKIDFVIPQDQANDDNDESMDGAGSKRVAKELKLYLISDCYIGCNMETTVKIEIVG